MKKKFQDILSPFFTPGQIKMILNPMQKMTHWSSEDIAAAISLRSVSPKAVHFDNNQFENNRQDGRKLLRPFSKPNLLQKHTAEDKDNNDEEENNSRNSEFSSQNMEFPKFCTIKAYLSLL
ncbi:hypothetical protein ALC57_04431 [Trachymyrmex cornetzi]|uniref:Uncharacterized protein n=1 Tax=Trachymyrmex cornetzi TaxID=471704 RepID=A0A151JCL5_9HYME|nr:hypothetical protein ALC57_04431 [Trachymyrmex cornetzi]